MNKLRKLDFRYPNHGGCMGLAAWLADQFDTGARTSITMEADILAVHGRNYAFRMSIKPASNGAFCCHVQADDTVLSAVKMAHSDALISTLATARHIVDALGNNPDSLRAYAGVILKDADLMRTLNGLVPGVETDLRVLELEQGQLAVG